MLKGCK
ncbi:hypothetical protein AB3S75_029378 [Citrus x aurantiifolia]